MSFFWIVLLSSLISLIGTMMGASIGTFIKNPSKKFIASTMAFAGGLMLSVVVFDLIPEAIEQGGFLYTLVFYILGMLIIYLIEKAAHNKESYSKIAFITALGLMLHNFPEGIIMGCSFLSGKSLGVKTSIIIALHDVPEGLAVTVPLIASNKNIFKIILYVFITALPTALGALIGVFIGNVSEVFLGICLALASGIMMYVVFGELIPESNNLNNSIINTISVLLGVTLGLVLVNVM
ncbi:ZIP family metal transporter [Clostridium hydrogeniformans]|uniref:ZIP family metal transporter n=1 Tax=Clostridium hydrogeniformans TaxID=349933 RepID=UPI00054FDAF5|nr:ZIP family metal transporter [Clostridium hydrogeniformans]